MAFYIYICARTEKKKCQSTFLLAKGSTGSGPRQVPKVARGGGRKKSGAFDRKNFSTPH